MWWLFECDQYHRKGGYSNAISKVLFNVYGMIKSAHISIIKVIRGLDFNPAANARISPGRNELFVTWIRTHIDITKFRKCWGRERADAIGGGAMGVATAPCSPTLNGTNNAKYEKNIDSRVDKIRPNCVSMFYIYQFPNRMGSNLTWSKTIINWGFSNHVEVWSKIQQLPDC